MFLRLFYFIVPFLFSTHRCRPQAWESKHKVVFVKNLLKENGIYHGSQFSVMDVLGDLHKTEILGDILVRYYRRLPAKLMNQQSVSLL